MRLYLCKYDAKPHSLRLHGSLGKVAGEVAALFALGIVELNQNPTKINIPHI